MNCNPHVELGEATSSSAETKCLCVGGVQHIVHSPQQL